MFQEHPMRKLLLLCGAVLLASCDSAYLATMEKVGVHKRDILVGRIEDTQQAQQEGQQQFKDALAQFKSVVSINGGELEAVYEKLNDEYEDSESAANAIHDRIAKVESVSSALFDEWQDEIEQYSNAAMKRDSTAKLKQTKQEYSRLIAAMKKAEKSLDPALTAMHDQVLYLKHNLNARAIASLKGELKTIDANVSALLANMQRSIDESDRFIAKLKQQ
jgi:hypothetical protein